MAPPLQRFAQHLFALVERLEPFLDFPDRIFQLANPRRRIDELLIEQAAVIADCFDLALEPRLVLERALLLGTDRFKLLVALFDSVRGRRAGWRCRLRMIQVGDFPCWTRLRLCKSGCHADRKKAQRRHDGWPASSETWPIHGRHQAFYANRDQRGNR